MRKMIVFAAVLGLATTAHAAQAPGQKCQSSKNQEAGKYASCLYKAEATLLQTKGSCSLTTATGCYDDGDCPVSETCTKDLTKYGEAVTKCEGKFGEKWATLTQKAADALDPCPDGLLVEEIKEAVDEHVANVAAGLAGEGLSDCSGELLSCEGDLSTCETDLGMVETDLTTCEGTLTTCDSNLSTCEGALVVALGCGDGDIDAGEDCDTGNLNGGTCTGEGFAGGVLRCDAGCAYDTSDCYASRFVDNGDGTITDNGTGRMWAKKSDDGSIHDKDRTDTWDDDRWFLEADGTAFDYIAYLNGAVAGYCFAGHCDWRLPTKEELQGLVVGSEAAPKIDPIFKAPCTAGCAVTACSCTRSSFYWSSTTFRGASGDFAWGVNFLDGVVSENGKTELYGRRHVRAVRVGL